MQRCGMMAGMAIICQGATAVLAAITLSTACARSAPTPNRDADVRALADAYLAAYFDRYPEVGTLFGVPGRRHDRLTDNSLKALRQWEQREDAWLAQVKAIAPSSLTDPVRATYDILREALEGPIGARVCRSELWGVSQIAGWQIIDADVLAAQPVGTEERRREALARWGTLPRFLETEIANLREGLRLGYTAPKGNVRLVVEQMDALLTGKLEDSPFYLPATKDPIASFANALRDLVITSINPAIDRYRQFLARDYLPAAPDAVAILRNPDGATCYAASVRLYASMEMPAQRIHDLGLAQMAQLDAEIRAIAERSFGSSDVPKLLERLRTDRQYTFKTRDDVMEYSRAAVARASAAVPQWFGLTPKAAVAVDRYPAFRERSGVGQYNPPAEDGSRPGVFLISTYEPEKRSRADQESTAFHETYPGHHLQVALALERGPAIHALGRYLGNSGFMEGWALYAERLADDMHLYSSDLDRLGMLSSQAYRAARLVIDPGIHTLGWTRQQSIDYLLAHTTAPRAEAESEVDRYIIWQGQATSYMLGMLEIRRLRDEAQRVMAGRFDIRVFHDRVLEDGAVPLASLGPKIERWIAAR
jgi:uncharacterized protein (DUF885 family)